MSCDFTYGQAEIKIISDCKVRLFFTEEENRKAENYVLNNLLETFEKRNNLCGKNLI